MGDVTSAVTCRNVAYLGPPGTFTEEALRGWRGLSFEAALPFPTVEETILAVQDGLADKAVVPIENSIEGAVNATLDSLAFEADVLIQGEKVCQVRHHLLARPGLRMEDITRVISHPQAAAQCRRHLVEALPGVEVEAANSTSEAARRAAESPEPAAAIGSSLAAELYGLEVLREGMEDHPGSLLQILQEFAFRYINLSKIESR